MAYTRLIVLCAGSVLLATAQSASAQRWGSDRPPREGVCFYEDADYGGDYFCVRSGEDLGTVPTGTNDRISSIRIFGRAEVTVFRDRHFEGASRRYTNDVRNLRNEGWNDRISSAQVRDASDYGRRGRGDDRSSRRSQDDPDRIVRRAYEDMLDRQPDAEGLRRYRRMIIDEGWTESDVREALRKSPEYRERGRMTREKAEEIVRDAYLAVLGREPDSSSRSYVDRILRDKWTRADVERELRKSPEYRGRR